MASRLTLQQRLTRSFHRRSRAASNLLLPTSRVVSNSRTTLTLEHGKDYLRGTWPSIILERFGRRLRNNTFHVDPEEQEEMAEVEYTQNSFVVEDLDIFLSHSWWAPWLQKYLALLIYFNFWTAMAAYAIVMILGAFILRQGYGIYCPESDLKSCSLPRATLHLVGVVIFFLVLFNLHLVWTSLNMLNRAVFLDKVCIHQTDLTKKVNGIKSIGAILDRTKTLLIAWDRSYFQRLWCAYEVCTYTYANPDGNIEILPIQLAPFMLAMIVFSFLAQLVTNSMHMVFGRTSHAFTVSAVVQGIALFVFSPSVRRYMRDLELIDEQISKFSIRESLCYCCTNNHVSPETGHIMPCDRSLVYASIAHWHGSGDEDEALNAFDKNIQHFLSKTYHPAPVGISYAFTVALGVAHNGSVLAMIVMFMPTDVEEPWQRILPKMMVESTIFIWETFILTPLRLAVFCYLAKCFSVPQSTPFFNFLVNVALALFAQAASVALGWLDDAVIDDFSEKWDELYILGSLMLLLVFPLLAAFSQRVNAWVVGRPSQKSEMITEMVTTRSVEPDRTTPAAVESW